MAVSDGRAGSSDGKLWGLCRIPFLQTGSSGAGSGGGASSTNTSSSLTHHQHHLGGGQVGGALGSRAQQSSGGSSVSSVARSIVPTRRRLRLDPSNKLYFPCK